MNANQLPRKVRRAAWRQSRADFKGYGRNRKRVWRSSWEPQVLPYVSPPLAVL